MQTDISTCGKCHRVLKDPRSIERGFGPVCWIAISNDPQLNLFSTDPADESDYTYRFQIDNSAGPVLIITDLDIGRKSVTNNMEAIIKRISADEKIDLRKTPITYRDSEGNFDGVSVSDSGQISFHPLMTMQRVKSEQEAIQAAQRLHNRHREGMA